MEKIVQVGTHLKESSIIQLHFLKLLGLLTRHVFKDYFFIRSLSNECILTTDASLLFFSLGPIA